VHVSDIFAWLAFLMVPFLFPLVEAIYPLWVEALIVVTRIPRSERHKHVSKAYATATAKRNY